MPSVSPAEHHLMEAVAHGWHKPGGGGPTPAVAKEFVAADKAEGKYAAGGKVTPMENKGYRGQTQHFAKGGSVLGKTSEFLKTPDEFTGRKNGPLAENATDEDWGKGSSKANPAAKGKVLKTVKSRT